MLEKPAVNSPKKVYTINLVYSVENDEAALKIKEQISNVLKDIKDKRLAFQVIET